MDFRYALLVGLIAAVPSGLIGYFLIIRNQVFAGDALSHVAFTGAMGAAVIGINQQWGLLVTTLAVGLILALVGQRSINNDVATGTLFSWLLGVGSLFLFLYATNQSAGNANIGTSILFGSILALDSDSLRQTLVIEIPVLIAMMTLARPLLFASLQPAVAKSSGLRVGLLNVAFMLIVAAQVTAMVQILGALLLLGLLVTPAAAAWRITNNSYRSMILSMSACVLIVFAGLGLAALQPNLPPSTCIIGVGFSVYVLSVTLSRRIVTA